MKYTSAEEAISTIKSGNRIFVHSAAATPTELLEALAGKDDLHDLHIYHIHTEGEIPYLKQVKDGRYKLHSFFIGKNTRELTRSGHADYISIFLSEIPALFRKQVINLDHALIQVSPPDKNGFCSLGVSVDIARAAVDCARNRIALVNERMPRTHGNSFLHKDTISHGVVISRDLYERPLPILTETDMLIGKHIASLVEDGATLQMGIGKLPDAALKYLCDRKHLGIHTEMFSDGVMELLKSGAITGLRKKKHIGKIAGGFVYGTRALYEFIDDNPGIELHDIGYINDTYVIAQNPKVTAINSALEVDVTGQVCADSIGSSLYSGVGGQMDFIRGASLSEGGKPIIAMNSVTEKGISKIVTTLKPGAGVVTTRAHVNYIVTEFGIAQLYGRSVRERINAMISVAHPDHREQLSREAFETFKYC